MTTPRRIAGIAAAVSALLYGTACSTAAAAPGTASEMTSGFTSTMPGAVAGMTEQIIFRSPSDPNAKPPALDTLRVASPLGTRFDPAALPTCGADDTQLHLQGPAACPPQTRLGDGTITGITGFGAPLDPTVLKLEIYNGAQGPIVLGTEPRTGLVLSIDRHTLDGNAVVAHPPAAPGGPPDFRFAIRKLVVHYNATGFVTTPPVCPVDGQWGYTTTIGFDDGSTQIASGSMRCNRTP